MNFNLNLSKHNYVHVSMMRSLIVTVLLAASMLFYDSKSHAADVTVIPAPPTEELVFFNTLDDMMRSLSILPIILQRLENTMYYQEMSERQKLDTANMIQTSFDAMHLMMRKHPTIDSTSKEYMDKLRSIE